MAEQLDYLKKFLLPYFEKEAPVLEREALPAIAPKSGEVIGGAAPAPAPFESPIMDADIITNQAPQGPNQLSITDQSLPDKWSGFKKAAPYAGAAAAGTAAGLLSGNSPVKASSAPGQQNISMPEMKVPVNGGDEEEVTPPAKSGKEEPEEDDNEETDAPESANKAPAAKGADNLASGKQLKAIQDRQNLLHGLAGLQVDGGLAYDIGGIDRPKGADLNTGAKEMNATADRLGTQYQQRVDFQKQDPNSPVSQQARELSKMFGITPNPQSSAMDLEKMNPMLEKLLASREAGKIRMDQAKIHSDDMHFKYAKLAEMRRQGDQHKAEQDQARYDSGVDRLITNVAKAVDPQVARQNTAYGKASMNYNAIQRVKNMMHGGTTPGELNKMTDPEVFEVNTAIASLAAAGGAPSEFSTKHMDRDSALRDIKRYQQWITNQPVGAAQGDQMMRALTNLNAQEKTSQDTMVLSQKRSLAPLFKAYNDPKTSEDHKAAIQSMLITAGLPVDSMERLQEDVNRAKNHKDFKKMQDNPGDAPVKQSAPAAAPQSQPPAAQAPVAPAGAQQAKDPQIDKYASDHGLDYSVAANILKSRGYNGGQ